MNQNLSQDEPFEDEINLREIFKLIQESKKLFFSTILFFTILSVVYSFNLKPEFKSSAILEIGNYELPDGSSKLVENSSDIISSLNFYEFLYFQDFIHVTSYEVIEDKLIYINTTSKSAEQNENLLTKLITFIDESHSELFSLNNFQEKNEIYFNIEMIESEISFISAKVLEEYQLKKLSINNNLELVKSEISLIGAKELNERQLMRLEIEDRIAELKNTLPLIDLEISQLKKVIFDDTNNLSLLSQINDLNSKKFIYTLEAKSLNSQLELLENDTSQSDQLFRLEQKKAALENELLILENDTFQSDQLFRLEQKKAALENELQILMNQTQVNTRLIGNFETDIINKKTTLIISLGVVIGLLTGILLVFSRNLLRS